MPKKSQNNKNTKRWFAAASGWGLDLEMGSGETTHKVKRSIQALAPDTKIYENNSAITAANFLHNTIYTTNILYNITQGTADSNRIGDRVHIKHASLKFLIDTGLGDNLIAPCYVRFMLVASTKQSSATAFTAGLGSTDLFYTNSGVQANARINPHLAKVMCDEIVYINSTVAAASGLGYGHIECPVNSFFEYQPSAGYGQAANLYLIAIPYTSGGTTGTTKVGTFNWSSAVAFSDK